MCIPLYQKGIVRIMIDKILLYACGFFGIFVLSMICWSGCNPDQSIIQAEDAARRDEYGCHRDDPNYNACHEKGVYYSDMCFNQSTLVATTAGSPNAAFCPNKKHKMRVDPVTKSGEEIASLVVCECQP